MIVVVHGIAEIEAVEEARDRIPLRHVDYVVTNGQLEIDAGFQERDLMEYLQDRGIQAIEA